MDNHEDLLKKIHAYRRDREDCWARFDSLLRVGHKLVEYARAGRRKMRQELTEITRLLDGLMANTPVYA